MNVSGSIATAVARTETAIKPGPNLSQSIEAAVPVVTNDTQYIEMCLKI